MLHQAQGIPYMEADLPSTPPTPQTPPAPATPPASPSSLHRLPTPPSSPVSIRVPSPTLQSPIDDSISTLSPSGEMPTKVDDHDQQVKLDNRRFNIKHMLYVYQMYILASDFF